MNIVSIENLSKSYGEKILFDDFSFSIGKNERIGLIGMNGAGKSTLLKIIAGLEQADKGKIIHAKGFRIEYLSQNPSFDPKLTILEQIFSGETLLFQTIREYESTLYELQMNPHDEKKQKQLFSLQQQMDTQHAWDTVTQAKTILTRLGIHHLQHCMGELSGGQRKRVAMASALLHPADLLILDEPTNHIDHETIEWLEDVLAKYTGSLLLVTHDRYFLNRVTNRIVELDHGKIYSYDGNYEYFLEKKEARIQMEQASEEKRQNLLRRELAWLRRGAKARTTKQKARIERVEALHDHKVDKAEELLDISVGASRLGKKVLHIDQITKSFGNNKIIQSFSTIVVPEDRIGIIGKNGSGKTTLLNLITGKAPVDNGSIDIGQTVKIAYYTQESTDLNENMRVLEYIKEAAEVIRTTDGMMITAAQMLERFQFPPHLQWTPISRLSGGECKRLYLLKTLMGEPNVLILDEPTNDLDIQTLTILEDYLEEFPGVVIIVSHDRYFLDRTIDRLWIFEEEGSIRSFIGNYSEYLENRKNEANSFIEEKKTKQALSSTMNEHKEQATPKKLSYKEQREWDEIEAKIEAFESRGMQIKQEIIDAGSDYQRIQNLLEQEKQNTDELEKLIERWTELSEKLEQIAQNR